jgi:hypothetical protein
MIRNGAIRWSCLLRLPISERAFASAFLISDCLFAASHSPEEEFCQFVTQQVENDDTLRCFLLSAWKDLHKALQPLYNVGSPRLHLFRVL